MFIILIYVGEGPTDWDRFDALTDHLYTNTDGEPDVSRSEQGTGAYALLKKVPDAMAWGELKGIVEQFDFVVWYICKEEYYGQHELYSREGRKRSGRTLFKQSERWNW